MAIFALTREDRLDDEAQTLGRNQIGRGFLPYSFLHSRWSFMNVKDGHLPRPLVRFCPVRNAYTLYVVDVEGELCSDERGRWCGGGSGWSGGRRGHHGRGQSHATTL